LAEIAVQAVKCSDLSSQSLQAFGYNMEMVFDQTSNENAFRYIGRRLFGNNPSGEAMWDFEGGAGRLVFSDSTGKRSFNIEPRFGDENTSRIFLSVNLHKNESTLPLQTEIAESLETLRADAIGFMNRLDERWAQ
jgi:hypothetical protein